MTSTARNLVYIVDDDPEDRQIILDAFLENNAGMDYVFIENGEHLMETLHSPSENVVPTLILLDLNMPGMVGLQVLKEIKGNKTFSHIPTIVLTTSSLNSDRKSSYAFGANCFLTKPDSFSQLVEIANAIARLWFIPV